MFIVNVEGAVHRDGKWLLIKRSEQEEHAGGTLSLVGGKADSEGDSMEPLVSALRRELLEEVGVEVKEEVIYLYSSSFVTDRGEQALNVVFLCEHARGEAYCKSRDEVAAVHWLTAEEVGAHPDAPPWTKASIRRAEAERLGHAPVKRFVLQRRQLVMSAIIMVVYMIINAADLLVQLPGNFGSVLDVIMLALPAGLLGAFIREWFVLREREREKRAKSRVPDEHRSA